LAGVLLALGRDSIYSRLPGATQWIGRPYRDVSGRRPGTNDSSRRAAVEAQGALFAQFDNRLYRANPDSAAESIRFTKLPECDVFGLYADSLGGYANLTDGLKALDQPGRLRPLPNTPLLGWIGPGETGILALARDGRSVYRSLSRGMSWTLAAPPLPR
jgi:hypothetical protein